MAGLIRCAQTFFFGFCGLWLGAISHAAHRLSSLDADDGGFAPATVALMLTARGASRALAARASNRAEAFSSSSPLVLLFSLSGTS